MLMKHLCIIHPLHGQMHTLLCKTRSRSREWERYFSLTLSHSDSIIRPVCVCTRHQYQTLNELSKYENVEQREKSKKEKSFSVYSDGA